MKKRKGPVLAAVLIAVVLTAAFFHGSRSASQETAAPAPAVSVQPVERAQEAAPAAGLPVEEPAISGEADAVPEQAEPENDAAVPATESAPAAASREPETPECTVSISCATILKNMDLCPPEKAELVPEDGWILQPTTVSFTEGESVFDVLQRVCRQNQIHMEYMDTPGYGSAYIEGIHNLYEFDVGELSGWMYSVNGQFPNYGCSQAVLQDGDAVCWVYTCDYGADVGGNNLTA